MKTSSKWNIRSVAGKIMMGLVLAGMIGGVGAAPAFADDRRHDNRRYQRAGHGYNHDRYVHDRRNYRPYGYREGYYAPPPPPPGIGIFFPPIFIRP
jgi:hypothetical protein